MIQEVAIECPECKGKGKRRRRSDWASCVPCNGVGVIRQPVPAGNVESQIFSAREAADSQKLFDILKKEISRLEHRKVPRREWPEDCLMAVRERDKRKQSRRTISVKRRLYDSIKSHCASRGLVVTQFVEATLGKEIGQ